MDKNRMLCAGEAFGGDAIQSGNCFIGNSLAADELTIDTLDAALDCSADMPTLYCPKGTGGMLTSDGALFGVRPRYRLMVHDPGVFAYGHKVEYQRDGNTFAVFYMSGIRRAGKYVYEISCVSAIGLLDNETHYGGLYSGTPMSTVLTDIIGGTVAYELDPAFAGTTVYGWLPVASKRENLHQLLFAEGASIKKRPDGTLRITALATDSPANIADNRLYLSGSIDYGAQATRAAVSEHAYHAYATDEMTTLFEGEAAAETILTPKGVAVLGVLVLFDGPMHGLVIENGSILESGVNYAVISQSSDCKLTGRKYTHTTRIITRGTAMARALVDVKDNEVSVKDATLVSLANSENVADRVMAYYGNARTVKNDIVVGEERPGDPVAFRDPFDEPAEGFVKSMDITMSGVLRASAELVAGYVPTGIGNYYKHSVMLTASGNWAVPASVTRIRAVIISGGEGGASGGAGAAGGKVAMGKGDGEGGAGGKAGAGGSGGRINIVTIAVMPGQALDTVIGTGGAGGTLSGGEPNPGSSGGDSSIAGYSSAQGRPSDSGYTDIFDTSGTRYAMKGGAGIAGGKGSGSGGAGDSIVFNGVTYAPGSRGEENSSSWGNASGGLGGGAAAGNNGGDGARGTVVRQADGSYWAQGGRGGLGAAGADGTAGTVYGSGGSGGHGGGGGGGGGAALSASGQRYSDGGEGGAGGPGSQGGAGAPGCIIIYY